MNPIDGPVRHAAPIRLLVPVGVAAGVSAALIPGVVPGLNIALTALAAAAAVLVAFRARGTWFAWAGGSCALILVLCVAVIDAPWVLAVDVMAALVVATLALAAASDWTEMMVASALAAWRALWSPVWLARGTAARIGPRRWSGAAPVLRGVGVGAILMIVFGTLFATADRAFAHLAGEFIVPDLDLGLIPARMVVFLIASACLAALCGFAPAAELMSVTAATEEARRLWRGPGEGGGLRFLGRVEWIVALALLDTLFAIFVAVQLTVLFGGRTHILATTGLTYAEYARSGFFQLVAVAFLTLAVIASVVSFGRRHTRRDDVAMQVLAAILCVLTLVVLASALKRLGLYETVFGFTRLRVAVHATILWLGVIVVMVLGALVTQRHTWLARATVLFTAVALIAFTLVSPDRLIAERNVERFDATGRIDVSYLATLSADAVPALDRLPEPYRSCSLGPLHLRLAEPQPLLSFNFSRAAARDVLSARLQTTYACP